MQNNRKMQLNIHVAYLLIMAMIIGILAPAKSVEAEGTDYHWYDDIPAMLSASDYVEGEVVVCIDYSISTATDSAEVQMSSVSDAEMDVYGEDAPEIDIEEEAEEIITTETVSDISIETIIDETRTTEEMLYDLANDPRVVFAEPNYVQKMDGANTETLRKTYSSLSAKISNHNKVADMTTLQWGCSSNVSSKVTGQGDNNPSINAPDFGEVKSGDDNAVVVAVLDLPVDFSNPDVKDVAYTFSDELQEKLGCDVHGYNATWQNSNGKLELWPGAAHGTHCAGIIGASWDGKGISGVASNVKIVSVQIGGKDERTSLINVLKGLSFIKRANEEGVGIRVTNNSYGLIQHSYALDMVLRDLGEKYGLVTVYSAGNSGKDNDYQTELSNTFEDNPYVITVAATDQADKRAWFTSYGGNTVTLGAPGVSILSTVDMASSTYMADATPLDNVRYEGFEGSVSPDATVSHVDGKGEFINDVVSAGQDSPRYSGLCSGLVNPDTASNSYSVKFNFGDVSGLSEDKLYFGFLYHSEDTSYVISTNIRVINEAGEVSTESIKSDYDSQNHANSWASYYMEIPSNADLSNLQITANFRAYSSSDKLYIDSVGVGSRLVPYEFMSGTSMAGPMVAGAVAELAAENPGLSGDELATLAKSKVRKNDELSLGYTTEGGVIDLGATTAASPSPVVSDAYIDGEDIVIRGAYFGNSIGVLKMDKYSVGMQPETIYESTKDSSLQANVDWSDDEIRVKYSDSFRGVMCINVGVGETAEKSKYSCKHVLLGRSTNIFEEELPYDNDLGDLYEFDALGDYDTHGVLHGLLDKLYYIPSITKVEREPAYKMMMRYDMSSGEWAKMPELPAWLGNVSATTYGKKLIVMGEKMKVTGDVAEYSSTNEMLIYQFDPATSKWTALSNGNTKAGQSIINNNDQLYVVGSDVCAKYSASTGAESEGTNLKYNIDYPSVAAKDGTIYIYDSEDYKFYKVAGGSCTEMKSALPDIVSTFSYYRDEDQYTRIGTLTPVKDGIMLIGPSEEDKDGSGKLLSDTFILKTGSDKFETYSKRMSDDKVFLSVATSYRGKLYAIGTSILDEDERFFRATAIEVDEYPGDSTPDIKPTPSPTPTPSGGGSGGSGGSSSKKSTSKTTNTLKWRANGKGMWVEDSSGWYPKNTWYTVNGVQYYFGADGYMARNEWRDGKWIGSNGRVTYKGKGKWKVNSTGWWYEDSLGWYPQSMWQKIDGLWYYFNADGYMASNEWRDGYWLSSNGSWTYSGVGSWSYSGGWNFADSTGWKARNSWQKINGTWYYFNGSGIWIN